ncbi:MAG: aminotransferase class V, partial [Actinomycetota bacterium]
MASAGQSANDRRLAPRRESTSTAPDGGRLGSAGPFDGGDDGSLGGRVAGGPSDGGDVLGGWVEGGGSVPG